MGCEPRGFGWSATVEVCSARVTRLVTDREKSKKISGTQLVPGTGLAPGWGAPGTGLGSWFASIRARSQQVPGTFVNSRIGMLAIDWGARWETLANFGVWVAFDGPGSSCGLSDQIPKFFFDYSGFVEVLVLD